MRLLRSETERVLGRRMVWAIVLVGVLGFSVKGFALYAEADVEAAWARAEEQVQRCEQQVERVRRIDPDYGRDSDERLCLSAEEYFWDPSINLVDRVPAEVRAHSLFLLFGALVIGVSLVGAEWQSGSMTVALTWEPVRGRLLMAKVVAATVTVGVFVLALAAFLSLVVIPAALLRGTTDGADWAWWASMAHAWLKVGALGGLVCAMAAAVTMVTRHAVGALAGAVLVVSLDGAVLARFLDYALYRWSFWHLVAEYLGYPRSGELIQLGVLAEGPPSAARPALLLFLYALVPMLVAYVVFRHRDVT